MNPHTQQRLLATVTEVVTTAHRDLQPLMAAADDYRSPLRSGEGPGCKGSHADPVLRSIIQPDPTARLHQQGVNALKALERAAVDLRSWMDLMRPIDPQLVDRGRVNSDPGCLVCAGPAPAGHRRGGKCDACRKAWDRAGRPPLEDFRRARARELEQRRIHEHEQDTA